MLIATENYLQLFTKKCDFLQFYVLMLISTHNYLRLFTKTSLPLRNRHSIKFTAASFQRRPLSLKGD
jgi:hypothetical protein